MASRVSLQAGWRGWQKPGKLEVPQFEFGHQCAAHANGRPQNKISNQ
jgi:hypothetical protein